MFPCKHCLVLPVCTTYCDTLSKRNRNTTSELINNNICPDCGTINKFNTTKNISLYQLKCKYCRHIFSMIGKIFVKRISL